MENELTMMQKNDEQMPVFMTLMPEPFKERIDKFDFAASVDDFATMHPDGDYSFCELIGYIACCMLGLDDGIATKKMSDMTEEDVIRAAQEFNIVLREIGVEEIPLPVEEPTEEE